MSWHRPEALVLHYICKQARTGLEALLRLVNEVEGVRESNTPPCEKKQCSKTAILIFSAT